MFLHLTHPVRLTFIKSEFSDLIKPVGEVCDLMIYSTNKLHKQWTLVFTKDICVHVIWIDYKKPLGGNNSPTKFPGFSFRPSSCLSSSACCLSRCCWRLWQIILCFLLVYLSLDCIYLLSQHYHLCLLCVETYLLHCPVSEWLYTKANYLSVFSFTLVAVYTNTVCLYQFQTTQRSIIHPFRYWVKWINLVHIKLGHASLNSVRFTVFL